MKKLWGFSLLVGTMLLAGCTSLTRQEKMQLQHLKAQGITVDKPLGNYEKPASVAGQRL